MSLDRVRGLNALRRSSAKETVGRCQSSLLDDDSHSRTKSIHYDPERLSRILGATPKTNQYGDYLSVRCWCAQPPRYSPELGALKLLLLDIQIGQKKASVPLSMTLLRIKFNGIY